MTPAQPLRKIPPCRATLLVVAFTVFAAISVWLCLGFNSMLYAAGLMLALFGIAWVLCYRRRCPNCNRRLIPFTQDIYGSTRYSKLFRCSFCDAVWESGKIGDHYVDENTST